MKKLMLLTLLLVGCDSVVSSSQIGQTRTEQRLGSCNKSGFCYTCSPGFDGEFKCGM